MKIHKSLPMLAVFCWFAFANVPNCLGQTEDLPYSSGSQGEDGALEFPVPLDTWTGSASIAFDRARDEVVVFGGQDSRWNRTNATWVWTKGDGWVQRFPLNSPPARWNSVMCFDAERGEIVLFGGWGQNGELNDTWVWDGEDWLQKNPDFSPPSNGNYYGHSLTYFAARKESVLIINNWGSASLYAWDGNNWQERTINSSPWNSSNSSNVYYPHSVAYDEKNQKIVLLNDSGTWSFDGIDWSSIPTSINPSNYLLWSWHESPRSLAYDPISEKILFFGGRNVQGYWGNETWVLDGTDWKQLTPEKSPEPRYSHTVVGMDDGVFLTGGYILSGSKYSINNSYPQGSTQIWNGSNWIYQSEGIFEFDMTGRSDGVWKYTKITIPKGLVVRFKKNANNTPVHWLAAGDVLIDGIVDVSGENSSKSEHIYHTQGNFSMGGETTPRGGPGGFDGGRGGVRYSESGSYAGNPGIGPGGGLPGTANDGSFEKSDGKAGQFTGSADASGKISASYGNTYLQPLVGGSGGGGSASSDSTDGAAGGGGGGAILIATSRDMIINGRILANGGDRGYSYNFDVYYERASGPGSGGAIRLVADRISGTGWLTAQSGSGDQGTSSAGRIRIEAYERALAKSGSNYPAPFQAPPSPGSPIQSFGSLRVVSVAGENVKQPPGGLLETPDVEFHSPGEVEIVVISEGVPDGTRVRVRLTMLGGELQSPVKLVENGRVSFAMNVPAGVGSVQAYSLRKDVADPSPTPTSGPSPTPLN